jgi:hypothetical protein
MGGRIGRSICEGWTKRARDDYTRFGAGVYFSRSCPAADVLNEAFEAVRRLAPERRDELAELILHLAADDTDLEPIDPAHLPAVLEALEQAKSGRFATPERIEAACRRFEA